MTTDPKGGQQPGGHESGDQRSAGQPGAGWDSGGFSSHDAPTIPSRPLDRAAPAPAAGPAVDQVESFGPYRVLEKLGEGGFGVVYACEQREPIRRRVALKVIKLGMDTQEVIARFEAERQALAMMDHPNVAKVLDAGVTPRGRPYFVMEYVAGMPITQYCDDHKLTMRQRLELFIQVCAAVQHAHQKGIIHRDLKPSNVLVTVVDSAPAPKVIDFGIAKATGGHLTERTMFTEAGRLIGTPEYMSPEQAGLSPLDVDTRSDVYALGVLLYELLTGMMPLEPAALRSAGFSEIQRIIREVDPPKPSTRVIQTRVEPAAPQSPVSEVVRHKARSVAEIAERRRTDPVSLAKWLRGDLDWITMRAMEKDRARRYETASALAADIQHFLKDEPVTAGPPSATYKMRKFAARHRAGVATAGAFAGIILASVVALIVMYRHAEAQRELAEQQRMRADVEAKRSSASFQFMSDTFASIDPAKAKGKEITVREMLDDAAKNLDQTKIENAVVEADVREVLGTAYHKLSIYEQSVPLLQRALDIRVKELGPKDSLTFEAMHNLGATMIGKGDLEQAEKWMNAAVDGRRELFGDAHRDTLASLSLKAYIQQLRHDFEGSEKTIREVIAAQTKLLGEGDRDTIDSRCGLADLLEQEGKFEAAEKYAAETAAISEKSLGADDPMTLQALSIRGSILSAQTRFDEAEKVLKRVVESKLRVFGEGNPDTIISQNALALVLDSQNKSEEAMALMRKLLEQCRARLGPDHRQTLSCMNNLAQFLRDKKQFDEAEPLYVEVLAADRRIHGEISEQVVGAETNLSLLYRDKGDNEKALTSMKHALEVSEKALPPGFWKTAVIRGYVGELMATLGQNEEGLAMMRSAYDELVASLGAQHGRTRQHAQAIAKVYEKVGNPEEAAKWKGRGAGS